MIKLYDPRGRQFTDASPLRSSAITLCPAPGELRAPHFRELLWDIGVRAENRPHGRSWYCFDHAARAGRSNSCELAGAVMRPIVCRIGNKDNAKRTTGQPTECIFFHR